MDLMVTDSLEPKVGECVQIGEHRYMAEEHPSGLCNACDLFNYESDADVVACTKMKCCKSDRKDNTYIVLKKQSR